MKIENQVCSLEQSAKLAILGMKQSSLFYWAINSYNQELKKITMHPDSRDIVYSAFTVAELFVMLDKDVFVAENDCHNLAKTIAGMLIYNLEHGSLSTTEVNQRLLISGETH